VADYDLVVLDADSHGAELGLPSGLTVTPCANRPEVSTSPISGVMVVTTFLLVTRDA